MCNLSEAIEEKGIEKGIALGVQALIETCRELNLTSAQTFIKLREKFSLSDDMAGAYMKRFWK